MHEHRLPVSRTARYFTLGEPGPSTRQVWFVCHGYGQLAARFLRHFAVLDDGSRLIVAPEGLSRFYPDAASPDRVGASWMTREDRLSEIEDYVAYLNALYEEVFRRIERAVVDVIALGFSQGAATVSRWVARGAARADQLVLWGEMMPPDLELEASREILRGLRLTLVYGRADQFATAGKVAETEERLRGHGIPFRVLGFEGGHELNERVLTELAAT